MMKQTDLSTLSPKLFRSLPAYEAAERDVPVSIAAGSGYMLRAIFDDVGRLNESSNVAIKHGKVVAHLPAPMVRYMGCDPRVARIVLQ